MACTNNAENENAGDLPSTTADGMLAALAEVLTALPPDERARLAAMLLRDLGN